MTKSAHPEFEDDVHCKSFSDVVSRTIATSVISLGDIDWSVFSLGPLKAAYPNFPLGFTENHRASFAAIEDFLPELKRRKVDLVRLSAPDEMLEGRPDRNTLYLPETRIKELQNWNERTLPSQLRRKLKKCRASGFQMKRIEGGDGPRLHAMYLRTVSRHGAKARYTCSYFEHLCSAAQDDPRLLIGKAISNEDIAGFIALKVDKQIAYYLHGAYSDHHSKKRPGFFTMAWAIQYSKDLGLRGFNFMTSPAEQPALRKFKESFGGESIKRAHWDVPLTLLGKLALGTSRWLRKNRNNH